MSTVAKILVVLNLGLAVFFMASASNFLGQQDDYKKQLATQEEHYTTQLGLRDEKISELTGRIQSLDKQLNSVTSDRDGAQRENARISGEITHLREAYNELSANATKSARAVEQLTNSLKSANDNLTALQKEANLLSDNLKAARDDRDAKVAMVNSLQGQLNSETENRKDLESRLAAAQENIQRLEFTKRWFTDRFPGAVPAAQPAHSGQILSADNTANVYVISLGEEDGVKAGFTYIVSRGGTYVATIQITDVQAKQAAGRAQKDISKGDIRRGDHVMNGQ